MSEQYKRLVRGFLNLGVEMAPVVFHDLSDKSEAEQELLYNEAIGGCLNAIRELGLYGQVCVGLEVYEGIPLFLMKTPEVQVPFEHVLVIGE